MVSDRRGHHEKNPGKPKLSGASGTGRFHVWETSGTRQGRDPHRMKHPMFRRGWRCAQSLKGLARAPVRMTIDDHDDHLRRKVSGGPSDHHILFRTDGMHNSHGFSRGRAAMWAGLVPPDAREPCRGTRLGFPCRGTRLGFPWHDGPTAPSGRQCHAQHDVAADFREPLRIPVRTWCLCGAATRGRGLGSWGRRLHGGPRRPYKVSARLNIGLTDA